MILLLIIACDSVFYVENITILIRYSSEIMLSHNIFDTVVFLALFFINVVWILFLLIHLIYQLAFISCLLISNIGWLNIIITRPFIFLLLLILLNFFLAVKNEDVKIFV